MTAVPRSDFFKDSRHITHLRTFQNVSTAHFKLSDLVAQQEEEAWVAKLVIGIGQSIRVENSEALRISNFAFED